MTDGGGGSLQQGHLWQGGLRNNLLPLPPPQGDDARAGCRLPHPMKARRGRGQCDQLPLCLEKVAGSSPAILLFFDSKKQKSCRNQAGLQQAASAPSQSKAPPEPPETQLECGRGARAGLSLPGKHSGTTASLLPSFIVCKTNQDSQNPGTPPKGSSDSSGSSEDPHGPVSFCTAKDPESGGGAGKMGSWGRAPFPQLSGRSFRRAGATREPRPFRRQIPRL